jgi:choline-glycine betaine transporter
MSTVHTESRQSAQREGGHPVMVLGAAALVLAYVLITVMNDDYAASLLSAAKSIIATELAS